MDDAENPLGRDSRRIESEYLERLHKVRFGMDHGWRPPGLLLKGGTSVQRAHAMERLKELALQDGFFCGCITLNRDLSLRDTEAVCRAAIEAAGLAGQLDPASDAQSELKRMAESARQLGRDGWVLLIDNVDRFDGTPRFRAECYRELMRWMGALPEEQYIGLFCVLAVTPEFEKVAASRELATIRADLGADYLSLTAFGRLSPTDRQLLDAADGGIRALDKEALVHELLVLEW